VNSTRRIDGCCAADERGRGTLCRAADRRAAERVAHVAHNRKLNMNTLHFTGRLAASPTLSQHDETRVAKFTLIRNDYVGKDKPERVTSIQFTAFNGRAKAIADNARKGDQLIVQASLQNNTYEKGDETVYGYNFVVDSFEFGAPGEESRERLRKTRTAKATPAPAPAGDFQDDDIPF
jgi:single-strand DNA-binding protein